MMANIRLVLLDRDGVVNYDSPDYIKSVSEWVPIPGSLEAIARLNEAGVWVAMVSNQSGVGRGLFSHQMLAGIHAHMNKLLAAHGGHWDAMFVCPHHPDQACECRKPKPGMLKQATHYFSCTPQETLMIGDSDRDQEAARALGCHAWHVGEVPKPAFASFLSLSSAVDRFLKT